MKSDKSFFSFLTRGGVGKLLPLLLLGILLFVIGSGFFEKEEIKSEQTELSAEEQLTLVCSGVEGVGRCKVMTTENSEGKICAAVVLCEGADSPTVRLKLTELICSLYGIRSSRVAVIKLE